MTWGTDHHLKKKHYFHPHLSPSFLVLNPLVAAIVAASNYLYVREELMLLPSTILNLW